MSNTTSMKVSENGTVMTMSIQDLIKDNNNIATAFTHVCLGFKKEDTPNSHLVLLHEQEDLSKQTLMRLCANDYLLVGDNINTFNYTSHQFIENDLDECFATGNPKGLALYGPDIPKSMQKIAIAVPGFYKI